MTSHPSNLQSANELGEQIAARPTDTLLLEAAAVQINLGHGYALFDGIFRAMEQVDPKSAVQGAMKIIESLAPHRADVGAYLMGRLYPMAGSAYRHDIYDRIESWMHHFENESAAQALLTLAEEGVRPRLAKQYRNWATLIRDRRRR